MSDFAQNGIVANLHDFSLRSTKQIEVELINYSKIIISKLDSRENVWGRRNNTLPQNIIYINY